jgi:hypothetical protein
MPFEKMTDKEDLMNKIILNFGLLIFFVAIIIFSQQGMLIQDVLIKSFVIFFIITLMLTLLALTFIKAINKTFSEKQKNINGNLVGTNNE